MAAEFDYLLKSGDTAPLFPDTLRYSNGQPADLSGATVTLVLRSFTAAAPITLAGTVTVVSATDGAVQYAPAIADSAIPGDYMGLWVVQFATTQMSFPTEGYLAIRIEENLVTAGGEQLVSVPAAKDYLNIAGSDRAHDAQLARLIAAARPIVENITGPIIPTVFDEWHMGGGPFIQIRRRPSTAYATTPILEITGVVGAVTLGVHEYLGSQDHPLTVVASPNLGSTYSCMIDRLGTITRRTSGGGQGCFPGGESVHVVYRAGQSSIPANVTEGTLELLRFNYQTTRPTGDGRMTIADDQDTGVPLGFYMPRRVREILAPNRRAPAVA